MIGARLLQLPLHLIVQAGAVADENRCDDGGGAIAPWRHAGGNGGTDPRAHRRERLRQRRTASHNFDEHLALHGSHQARAFPAEVPLRIGYARIEIPRRPPQHDGRAHAPPRSPLLEAVRGRVSTHAEDQPARCGPLTALEPQMIDVDVQAHATRTNRRVRPQGALDPGEQLKLVRRKIAVEPRAQRRIQCRATRLIPQHESRGGKSGEDSGKKHANPLTDDRKRRDRPGEDELHDKQLG